VDSTIRVDFRSKIRRPSRPFRRDDRDDSRLLRRASSRVACSGEISPSVAPRCGHGRNYVRYLENENPRAGGGFLSGRYWARTSDPQLVESDLGVAPDDMRGQTRQQTIGASPAVDLIGPLQTDCADTALTTLCPVFVELIARSLRFLTSRARGLVRSIPTIRPWPVDTGQALRDRGTDCDDRMRRRGDRPRPERVILAAVALRLLTSTQR
jgi:hypothetical protein